MSIRNPLLFDDGLNPSRGKAPTQCPEARFREGLNGLTLAAFESALGFYGMDEQDFFRSMVDRLIHHHQNFAELEWPLDLVVKHSVRKPVFQMTLKDIDKDKEWLTQKKTI